MLCERLAGRGRAAAAVLAVAGRAGAGVEGGAEAVAAGGGGGGGDPVLVEEGVADEEAGWRSLLMLRADRREGVDGRVEHGGVAAGERFAGLQVGLVLAREREDQDRRGGAAEHARVIHSRLRVMSSRVATSTMVFGLGLEARRSRRRRPRAGGVPSGAWMAWSKGAGMAPPSPRWWRAARLTQRGVERGVEATRSLRLAAALSP
jgi:hypothetical protein